MNRELYLLPLRSAILSLRMDLQRVKAAAVAELGHEKIEEIQNVLAESRKHRQLCYEQYTAVRSRMHEKDVELISSDGDTPVHSRYCPQNICAYNLAMKLDYFNRMDGKASYFPLAAAKSLNQKAYLAKFLNIDIHNEVCLVENNAAGFSITDILKLPTELAVDQLIEEVGHRFCGKQKCEDPQTIMDKKIETGYFNKIGGDLYAERALLQGLKSFKTSFCNQAIESTEYQNYCCICPGCLSRFLNISLNNRDQKTILRDALTGQIINQQIWFNKEFGFYQGKQKNGEDLRCINIYE